MTGTPQTRAGRVMAPPSGPDAGPGGSTPRPPGPAPSSCSKCNREPPKPGQRWGKACHAAYMRGRRAAARELRAELAGLVGRLRAEATWPPG